MAEFRYKQVLVYRSDLKLGRGKLVVQCCHAAVSAAEETRRTKKTWWKTWVAEGQCKIAVKVKTEKELLALIEQVKKLALPHALIIDKGLTQIPPGTKTCVGIGPAPAEKINKITGKLPLL